MSIISSTAHSSGDSGFYDYPIGQSLRFDGSSYLSKQWNQAYTSQTITYSLWVKFSDLSATNTVLWAGTDSEDSTDDDGFDFYQNKARIFTNSGNGSIGSSTALFRDTSSWYHFVMTADSTNGFRIYVNGGTSSINTVGGFTNHNFNNNSSYAHIGAQGSSATFKGYMAEINFIDGQALNPFYFGEFKNGSVWIPKQFNGTASDTTYNVSGASNAYGTNGFRLSFSDATSTTTLGYDSSGNSNHWTLV